MSVIDRLRSIEVSTRTAVICVVVALLVATAVVLGAKNAANRKPADSASKPKAQTNTVKVKISERRASLEKHGKPSDKTGAKTNGGKQSARSKPSAPAVQGPPVLRGSSPARGAYSVIAERNLFRPLVAGASPSQLPSAEVKKPSAGSSGPKPNVPALPPQSGRGAPGGPPSGGGGDSKKTVAFTGVVETPDGKQALLENLQTKETRFVKQGESAFGCRVVSIGPQVVSLEKDGSQFTLSIGENKSEAPAASPPAGGKPGPEKPPEGGPPK